MTFRRRMSAITLAAVIGLATVVPGVSAMNNEYVQHQVMQQMKVASYDDGTEIDKAAFVKKFHELFPGKFDFLTEKDFEVQRTFYPENGDGQIRTSVYIHKAIKGGYFYGNMTFVGDDNFVEDFYLDYANKEGAYYPPKVSADEAGQIAKNFIGKFADGKSYKLKGVEKTPNWGGNQTLTEPIIYYATFELEHDGIPIIGQEKSVTVLGNGDIMSYYGGEYLTGKPSFESKSALISEERIKEKYLSAINFDLRYLVYPFYGNNKSQPVLAYVPTPSIGGIRADGDTYFDGEAFVNTVEAEKGIRPIIDKPLEIEKRAITEKDAKQIAEQILPKQVGDWKLKIYGVSLDRWSERELYSVDYMYENKNESHGSNLAIYKDTGELSHFYNAFSYLENVNTVQSLTIEEAEQKAIEIIKNYAPSQAHLFSLPTKRFSNSIEKRENKTFHFVFPMIRNGIEVEGFGINVEISATDGSLQSFHQMRTEKELDWPYAKDVVSKDVAKAAYEEALTMKLSYIRLPFEESNQYYLVYIPELKDGQVIFDAKSGRWITEEDSKQSIEIPGLEGHWAEKEIKYLTDARILTSIEGLSPNKEVTKAAALEVVLKSIESVYEYSGHYIEAEKEPTYQHIDRDHPLFFVVERAVERGILTGKETLDLNATISREELAMWYIRGLGLEKVAQHDQIFKLPFNDAEEVSKDKVGYVALANAYGIFIGDKESKFYPQRHATLGELAVSSFKYGLKATEEEFRRYY